MRAFDGHGPDELLDGSGSLLRTPFSSGRSVVKTPVQCPRTVRARPAATDPALTVVTLYGAWGYDGHAVLDEDATRRLRDELNDCLTGAQAREMRARWGASE